MSDDTPRILISRMNAIGDSILTLPVACALREQFPKAYLAWVVEKKAAPMVRGHRALDAVIELPSDWYKSIRGIRQTRDLLRSHDLQISLDCQGRTRSAMAGWLAGADKRIGYSGRHASQMARAINNTFVTPVFNHVTDRALELLISLDIHSPRVRWNLPLDSSARTWATNLRRRIPSANLAILNPGATETSRLWEPDRFAATAKYLRDRYRYQSMVAWGTFEDRLMAEKIVALSGGAATLAPATDLNHLAALIEVSDLFISGDTGPLHIAVAVGTTTIGLYGSTRPGDTGPYGQVAIQKDYQREPVSPSMQNANAAMRTIKVNDVCESIDQLEERKHWVAAA